jgi:hypothetical protein
MFTKTPRNEESVEKSANTKHDNDTNNRSESVVRDIQSNT